MARKILLADDSVTAQNMGRKILADAGYDVATVNNGSAALKRIADLQPDLIVLDVYMPGYSGLEVCQRLKDSEETAHIPVLLSVGKLEPFKPEEARRVRADAHIIKPFEASELLTAITQLEDLLATRPANGLRGAGVDSGAERFRSSANGRKSENNSGADTGWKSRLGFSAKKKKDEKDEADESATGAFRDFRKGKRSGAGETKKVKPTPGPELAPVANIPGDITPDELDALSALAAKLEQPLSAAENVAPSIDVARSIDQAVHENGVASTEASAAVPVAEIIPEPAVAEAAVCEAAISEAVVAAPVVEATTPESPTVEVPVFAVEGKSEIEIPVEHVELPTEAASVAAADGVAEVAGAEIEQRTTEATAKDYSENQPSGNQSPQDRPPQDQSSEAQSSESQSSESQSCANQPSESQPLETSPPEIAATMNAALFVQEPACVDRDDEPMFASSASATEQEMEEPAPSDAELVQALQLLTPANWNAEAADQSAKVAGAEASHGEFLHQAAAGPRWVAEPVALSPEEMATSLEAEMFRTFATAPTPDAVEAVAITGISAIEAAVEHTLAATERPTLSQALPEASLEPEAERIAGEQDLAPQESGHHHQSQGAETKVEETSVAEERVASAEMELVTAAAITDATVMDAGPGDPAEAAKSDQLDPDEAPKAKAAAAAAEGGESNSAPDASTIASIVDRVMADLRPRIVEEITKKLGGK